MPERRHGSCDHVDRVESRVIPYRPDIDGLRAIAIVTVVLCHVGVPGWSGGYVGVDVFFVISGFLITSMLVTEMERTGRIDLWGFYARRVRRLLPAFLAVVLVTLALGHVYLVALDGERQGLAKSALWALAVNANHYFWHATGDYFDREAELHPLLHTWSLSVEEQFYLVWPLALIGLARRRPALGYRTKVVRLLLLVALASLAYGIWCLSHTRSAGFYLMPARAWELAAGALTAVAPMRSGPRQQRFGAVFGAGGLVAIASAVMLYDRTTAFPGAAALLPVLGAVAVIAGNGLAPRGLSARFLSIRAMVGIGLVSYSWYLWHWPLLAIARSAHLGDSDLARDFLLAVVVAFGLACATYRWIERPTRRSQWLQSLGTKTSVGLGATASVACLLLAASLGAWAKYGAKSQTETRMAAAQRDLSPFHADCQNTLDQAARLSPLAPCLVPAGSGRIDVALVGDSYAQHWMPAFEVNSETDGIATYQLTRDACPPLMEFRITHSDPTQAAKCLEFQRIAFEEIHRLREVHGLRGVILSASWSQYVDGPLEASLSATLRALDERGLRVLIVAPSPTLRYKVPECLLRYHEARCTMSRAEFDRQRAPAHAAIERVAKERRNVRILDPASILCDENVCPPVRNGVVTYMDRGHLTATAARTLATSVGADLSWLGERPD